MMRRKQKIRKMGAASMNGPSDTMSAMQDRMAFLSTLGGGLASIVGNGVKAIAELAEKTKHEEGEKTSQEEHTDDNVLTSEAAKHILKLDRDAKRRRLSTYHFQVR